MGIVLITMKGDEKEAFARMLQARTGGAVDLVIVQKPVVLSKRDRKLRLLSILKPTAILKEVYSALLLRLFPKTTRMLKYFRKPGKLPRVKLPPMPPVLEVDSPNSDAVYRTLKKLSPDLMVVWGSRILQPRIINTAKQAINLHIGRSPAYRGTLANQSAVLADDRAGIGATVHRVASKVDAGSILAVIEPDMTRSPRQLFADLYVRAQEKCIAIAGDLYKGITVPEYPQDITAGKNLLMREWTPSVRWAVAKRMKKWEQEFQSASPNIKLSQDAIPSPFVSTVAINQSVKNQND